MDSLTRTRASGALTLVAYFVAFCAVLLALAAIGRRRHRAQVLGHWPTTAATIGSCDLHRDYPFQSDGGGIVFWIACKVAYAVGGEAHSATLDSTTRHTGRSGTYITFGGSPVVTERAEPLLRGWIRRHPPGTTLTLRYDPANPSAPTFIGVDGIVDVDPVPGTVTGVIVFTAIAAGLALIGRALARGASDQPTTKREPNAEPSSEVPS
ncbi:MAG TPA: DUF3592 domain-containing protein [Candidatus Binatia bacterium]|jgi:hypothetical protein